MRLLASLLLIAALSLGVVIEGTTFQPVEISLIRGRAFKGEVIAVRESTVVLGTRPGLSPVEMMKEPGALIVVPFHAILGISTEGSHNGATGFLVGAPLGCLGGYAIGSSIEVGNKTNDIIGCWDAANDAAENRMTGMAVGFLAGAAIGCAAGSASGEKGQNLITGQQRDFTFLRAVARFPNDEPESLKKIGR